MRVSLGYLGVVDEAVTRPGVRRQLAGARKLQTLDDGGLAGTVGTND